MVWQLLRPDAVRALDDPGVKEGLPRYVKVVRNKLPARFQLAKRVNVDFGSDEKLAELWRIHKKGLKNFEELKRKTDKGADWKSIEIAKPSLLDLKFEIISRLIKACCLCERKCKVNRLAGERGFCKAPFQWKIFGAHKHYGEEPCLVPSATLFQAACTLRCIHCQNAPESIRPRLGSEWSIEKVAKWIKREAETGARNINWVGGEPTPWFWHQLQALRYCNADIAQVWNSNSYYSSTTAQILKGIVDVYLLDFKYFSNECALQISKAPGYPATAKRNHLDAFKDSELLIRVLVLPEHLECDAKPILRWIKENLGPQTRVNVMGQYRPCWKAEKRKELAKPLSGGEHSKALRYAREIGLKNLVKG